MESTPELQVEIDGHLRKLRAADTQAAAIAWMKKAYLLLEECQQQLKDRPAQVVKERLVFVPDRPKLEIVSELPRGLLARTRPPLTWFNGETVVYPAVPMPPAKPQPRPEPKAWTHKDTLRLERQCRIQRRGR